MSGNQQHVSNDVTVVSTSYDAETAIVVVVTVAATAAVVVEVVGLVAVTVGFGGDDGDFSVSVLTVVPIYRI